MPDLHWPDVNCRLLRMVSDTVFHPTDTHILYAHTVYSLLKTHFILVLLQVYTTHLWHMAAFSMQL